MQAAADCRTKSTFCLYVLQLCFILELMQSKALKIAKLVIYKFPYKLNIVKRLQKNIQDSNEV